MKYIPRRFEGRHFLSGSVTQGKASKKLFVTSASDPAATDDTGLGYAAGTTWVNTTSGQVFICTSDSAEDATWRGQEGDDVNHSPAWQGLTYAYELGGATPGPTAMSDKISRWPVAAPYPTADVGELAQGIAGMASYVGPGNVGFTAGGYSNPGDTHYAEVTSFPTAGPPVSTSNQGDLARGVWAYGSSGWSPTEGYTLGGQEAPATRYVNTIDKFTFAAPFAAADVAEMAAGKDFMTSHDDTTHTYVAGGWIAATNDNIERFQKSTTTDSTDTGELTDSRSARHGNSDVDGGYGYVSGGGGPPPLNEVDVIQRFPFASSTPSTDIGESSTPNAYGSHRGASTLTHGHTASRYGPGGDGVERFAFGSSTSGAEIGEIANLKDDLGMLCV